MSQQKDTAMIIENSGRMFCRNGCDKMTIHHALIETNWFDYPDRFMCAVDLVCGICGNIIILDTVKQTDLSSEEFVQLNVDMVSEIRSVNKWWKTALTVRNERAFFNDSIAVLSNDQDNRPVSGCHLCGNVGDLTRITFPFLDTIDDSVEFIHLYTCKKCGFSYRNSYGKMNLPEGQDLDEYLEAAQSVGFFNNIIDVVRDKSTKRSYSGLDFFQGHIPLEIYDDTGKQQRMEEKSDTDVYVAPPVFNGSSRNTSIVPIKRDDYKVVRFTI